MGSILETKMANCNLLMPWVIEKITGNYKQNETLGSMQCEIRYFFNHANWDLGPLKQITCGMKREMFTVQ